MPDPAITPAPPGGEPTPPPVAWTDNPSLAKFGGDAGKLATSYLELEKSFSGRVRIPGADAKPEEMAAFHKALGVPETADGYKVEFPAAPEGMTLNTATFDAMRGAFHAAGLTPAQVQRLVTSYAEHEIARQTQAQADLDGMRQTNVAALEKEWGAAFKQNMALADKAVETWGDAELKALWADPRIGTVPELRRFMAKVGRLGLEAKYYDTDTVSGLKTAQDIEKRMAEIRADPAWYNDFGPNAARHAALVREMQTLTEQRPVPTRQ